MRKRKSLEEEAAVINLTNLDIEKGKRLESKLHKVSVSVSLKRLNIEVGDY